MLAPEHPAYRSVTRCSPLRRGRVLAALLAGLVLVPGDGVVPHALAERRTTAQVSGLLPGLQAFVERERGLAFLRPVRVDLLERDAFLAEVGGVEGAEAGDDAGATLQGLGQLSMDEDLVELVGDALDEGVDGFYAFGTDRIVLRGTRTDAAAQQVLVHELGHALQDQHGLLDAEPPYTGDDERPLAFASLVEGDATRVEQAWYRAQPHTVRRGLHDPGGDRGSSGVLTLDELDFPYAAGPRLVGSLLERGGQAALDEALRDPPVSSAQALHPGRGPGRPVEPPEPGRGTVVDRGVLGELGLASLLEEDPLDEYGLQRAWDGDAYVTVVDGRRTCTSVRLRAQDRWGRDLLLQALRRWARAQPGAEVGVEGGSGLLLRSCTS